MEKLLLEVFFFFFWVVCRIFVVAYLVVYNSMEIFFALKNETMFFTFNT